MGDLIQGHFGSNKTSNKTTAGSGIVEAFVPVTVKKFPKLIFEILGSKGTTRENIVKSLQHLSSTEVSSLLRSSLLVKISDSTNESSSHNRLSEGNSELLTYYKEIFDLALPHKEKFTKLNLAIRILLLNYRLGNGGTGMRSYKDFLIDSTASKNELQQLIEAEESSFNVPINERGALVKYLSSASKENKSQASNDPFYRWRATNDWKIPRKRSA